MCVKVSLENKSSFSCLSSSSTPLTKQDFAFIYFVSSNFWVFESELKSAPNPHYQNIRPVLLYDISLNIQNLYGCNFWVAYILISWIVICLNCKFVYLAFKPLPKEGCLRIMQLLNRNILSFIATTVTSSILQNVNVLSISK